MVGDDRDGKVDSPGLSIDVENHLLKAAWLGDDVLDILDRRAALREPCVRIDHEGLERSKPLDASAQGIVQLGLAGERLDQSIVLAGHQTVEVGDRFELLPLPLLLQPLHDRRGEQLGDPRHSISVPQPTTPPQGDSRGARRPGAMQPG
jgi:hypothetical protein